jgi:hypothetical protein
MNRFKDGLVVSGLIIWIIVGLAILYRFGILERYSVGNAQLNATLVRNTLTGHEWVCSIFGCKERKIRAQSNNDQQTEIANDPGSTENSNQDQGNEKLTLQDDVGIFKNRNP